MITEILFDFFILYCYKENRLVPALGLSVLFLCIDPHSVVQNLDLY